jgi:hypothetical protein
MVHKLVRCYSCSGLVVFISDSVMSLDFQQFCCFKHRTVFVYHLSPQSLIGEVVVIILSCSISEGLWCCCAPARRT